MKVRRAQQRDVKDIATIQVRTWQEAYKGLILESYLANLSIDGKVKKWKKILNNEEHNVFVIEVGGKVSGFAGCGKSRADDAKKTEGEIYSIYIDHTFLNKGLGTALENEVIKKLKEKGFTSASLWVINTNLNARKFYEACGWQLTEDKKVDKRDGFELLELCYRKRL